MKLLNTTGKTPPGGWRYFVPETKRWVPSPNSHPNGHLAQMDLMDDLRKHYSANGIQPPGNIELVVQDQMCASLPAGWCNENGVPVHAAHAPTAYLDFSRLKQGTETLLRWALTSRKYVDQAEADKRAKTCLSCHWNTTAAGCTGCNMPAIHTLVDQIRMGRQTGYDGGLQACGVCGCSLKAKIWLPIEDIKATQTDEQRDAFPDWCWAK